MPNDCTSSELVVKIPTYGVYRKIIGLGHLFSYRVVEFELWDRVRVECETAWSSAAMMKKRRDGICVFPVNRRGPLNEALAAWVTNQSRELVLWAVLPHRGHVTRPSP